MRSQRLVGGEAEVPPKPARTAELGPAAQAPPRVEAPAMLGGGESRGDDSKLLVLASIFSKRALICIDLGNGLIAGSPCSLSPHRKVWLRGLQIGNAVVELLELGTEVLGLLLNARVDALSDPASLLREEWGHAVGQDVVEGFFELLVEGGLDGLPECLLKSSGLNDPLDVCLRQGKIVLIINFWLLCRWTFGCHFTAAGKTVLARPATKGERGTPNGTKSKRRREGKASLSMLEPKWIREW